MNANELADLLETNQFLNPTANKEATTMLRQLQAENEALKRIIEDALTWVQANDREKPFTGMDLCGEMVTIRLTGLCMLARAIGKRDDDKLLKEFVERTKEIK